MNNINFNSSPVAIKEEQNYIFQLPPLSLQDQLTEAILSLNSNQVKDLLNQGADPMGQDRMKNDYLGIVANEGDEKIANLLIEKMAELIETKPEVKKKLAELVKKEVEQVAIKDYINTSFYHKEPCLIAAFRKREYGTDMFKYLLENGADANVTFECDGNDKTILAVAVGLHIKHDSKKHDIIELLLKNGADPDLEYELGSTPYKIALQHKEESDGEEVIKLLEQYRQKK